MTAFRCHFDGEVLVPDEPVRLPVNKELRVFVDEVHADSPPAASTLATLSELCQELEAMPDDPTTPEDLAQQHDHYLYGTAKRP